jgi:hypothetical protein
MPWYHLFLKYFATDTNTTKITTKIKKFPLGNKKSFNATHTKETCCCEKNVPKVIKVQEFYFYEIAIFRQ